MTADNSTARSSAFDHGPQASTAGPYRTKAGPSSFASEVVTGHEAATLADLSVRLQAASECLTRMAADHGDGDPDGRDRLVAKASGVQLALSYVEEYRRGER